MHITLIASPGAQYQVAHQLALAAGFEALGFDVTMTHGQVSRTQHVACWGWRIGQKLRAAGHDVLVVERGYLGDRFAWSSLAWNGLNGRGEFAAAPVDGGERFREHFTMQPWKDGGEYVLLLGQVPGDASLQGRDLMPWYEQTAERAAAAYGLPVRFRPHPQTERKGIKQQLRNAVNSRCTLEEDLAGAAAAITFNSNSAVDAVLAGVPAVTMDQGAMAWDVTGHKVGELLKPERERWAAELAWKQWTLSEIESGAALKGLVGYE
ncbi:hypothetical protein [Halopseudomonas sp.]|uniref:hypothetical protein n=1 Tax=Halopseudomonas sp. TaxID=2901191 RepID=UPI00311DAFCF